MHTDTMWQYKEKLTLTLVIVSPPLTICAMIKISSEYTQVLNPAAQCGDPVKTIRARSTQWNYLK